MRHLLQDLPQGAQDAVGRKVGGVLGFAPDHSGGHAALAGTIRTPYKLVFCKGVPLDDAEELAALRAEAAVLPHAGHLAPELLFTVEADGWMIIGTEHVSGHHPEYHPGSRDLELLADAIRRSGTDPTADRPSVQDYRQRFRPGDGDTAPLAGSHLLHADLNPGNVLITWSGRVRLVDWAFCARGAPWLESALLIPWLIVYGHTPAKAEHWAAARLPHLRTLPDEHLDLLAGLLAKRWTRRPHSGLPARYEAAVTAWHRWRSGHVGT